MRIIVLDNKKVDLKSAKNLYLVKLIKDSKVRFGAFFASDETDLKVKEAWCWNRASTKLANVNY